MTRGNITSEEERGVDELRRRLKGTMSEDLYADTDMFIRFLRARNHNLDAAEEMLSKHMLWRKSCHVDKTLTEYKVPELFEKYMPISFVGFDKEHCPVTYVEIGNIDVKGLAKCIKASEVSKFLMNHLETDIQRLKTQSEKHGRKIERWSYIIDFQNFSLTSATDKKTIDCVIALIKMYDANYPERLKTGYMINVSFYFTILWSVIKPFLSAETNRKVKIFGKDGWQEELNKAIGLENMPEFLGGTVKIPQIAHGGTIPAKYFVQRARKSFSKLPGVQRLVVNRRSKEAIILEVDQAGSNIEWDFDLKNKDITFSLSYQDPNNKSEDGEEIVPKQRVDTEVQSESGIVRCEKAGTYVLQFDNSFSWMHNKIIYYYAKVVHPNEAIQEEED